MTQKPRLPPGAMAGPIPCQEPEEPWNRVAIVGEAPGRTEIINGTPFSGPAGHLLDKVLLKAGVDRANTLVTNTFQHQPGWSVTEDGRRKNNDIMNFFTHDPTRANPKLPPYKGAHVLEELADDIRNTWRLLKHRQPALIICMGSTALWCLTHLEGITQHRGTPLSTKACDATVFATFHTAYVLHKKDPSLADIIETDIRLALATAGIPLKTT